MELHYLAKNDGASLYVGGFLSTLLIVGAVILAVLVGFALVLVPVGESRRFRDIQRLLGEVSRPRHCVRFNYGESLMDDERFLLTFPVYVPLFKDGTGTVWLTNGSEYWLPLFTDKDSVQTYL